MSSSRRLSSTQMAGLVQFAVAVLLAVALLVAIWRFSVVAPRLPGGAGRYVYLPVAMGGFFLLAVWRAVTAWRLVRGGRSRGDRPPPE